MTENINIWPWPLDAFINMSCTSLRPTFGSGPTTWSYKYWGVLAFGEHKLLEQWFVLAEGKLAILGLQRLVDNKKLSTNIFIT